MHSVLLTLKNKDWSNIYSGIKDIVIYKAKPKNIKLPFRCICYIPQKGICGQFVCDKIVITNDCSEYSGKGKSCLSKEYIEKYIKNENIYAWHIENYSVKQYEKALALSEFGLRKAPRTWQCQINYKES